MGKLKTRPGSPWERLSFQLGSSILISAIAPYLARLALGVPAPSDLVIMNSTLVGVACATIVAVWLARHIATYPGEEAAAPILPAFGLAYGILLGAFILFRLQYYRVNLLLGFFLGLSWMFVTLVMSQRRRPRIGVVPFGDVQALFAIDRVRWIMLEKPGQDPSGLDAVTVDLRSDLQPEWEAKLADYALSRIPVLHTKHLAESLTGRLELEHLSEHNFGGFSGRPAYMPLKYIVDWVVALVIGVVLLPFLIVLGIVVRMTSPGPALFVQERVGYLGRRFKVYKFRTMTDGDHGADPRHAAITKAEDSRITPLGRVLRKTRIDELPQLLNVIKGEMSFIGPRPEAVILSEWYEREIPFYRYRHIVRPGIAGWAQVCQGHVADVDEVRSKLHYDFYYIKNYSPWIDLMIFVKAIRVMITGYGSR